MKVILFGTSGMVGQGVLLECLRDPEVEHVLSIARRPGRRQHAKLQEIVLPDVSDLRSVAGQLAGYQACFFCLGVSSVGMSEGDYTRVTHDLTLAVARTLVERSPGLTFVYVSGEGTDSSERGKSMWARVKGRTENALRALPFAAAYMFRPGVIQPLHGVRPATRWQHAVYLALAPLIPLFRRLFPRWVTSTEKVGRAMIEVVRHGAPQPVLATPDINAVAARAMAVPAT
jgi:uncharacterized protein YbjT (DUF2867 family)